MYSSAFVKPNPAPTDCCSGCCTKGGLYSGPGVRGRFLCRVWMRQSQALQSVLHMEPTLPSAYILPRLALISPSRGFCNCFERNIHIGVSRAYCDCPVFCYLSLFWLQRNLSQICLLHHLKSQSLRLAPFSRKNCFKTDKVRFFKELISRLQKY